MVLKLPWSQKRMFWAFEKCIFQFFANFLVAKLKPFSGKVREIVQNYLNQNSVIGSFLENGFETTSSLKTNVLSVWVEHFSVFLKFLSGEVESLFWEIEVKHSRLFKSRSGQRTLLRKFFWSYLELKNEFCKRLKRVFFSFLQNFEWRRWNCFLGNQCCNNFFDKFYFIESILEGTFESLFDHSRQSLLEVLNISNVLNVSIWIFNRS